VHSLLRRIPLAATLVAATLILLAPSAASAKTFCGKVHMGHITIGVYRIHGTVTCRRARRLSRRVIGDTCFGDKIGGYTCTHGAPALHEPASSGFTLRRGRNVIEGRVR
jgi:hypothetical protein